MEELDSFWVLFLEEQLASVAQNFHVNIPDQLDKA